VSVFPTGQCPPRAHRSHSAGLVNPTTGVLSGPHNVISGLFAWLTGKIVRESGCMVESLAAIQALEALHPETVAWWKQNTPHLVRTGKCFVFQQGGGHVIE